MFLFCSRHDRPHRNDRATRPHPQEDVGIRRVGGREGSRRPRRRRDPDARQAATRTLHVICRSVRQTLALEARFERDQRRTEVETRIEAERFAGHAAEARQTARKTAVRRTVEHLIWHEWDISEQQAEHLLRDVDMKLANADFDLSDPVEDQILLLCRRLGYNPVEDDDDDDEDDEDDEDVAVPKATSAPTPKPVPANGRLAPPRDLPNWFDNDTT